MPVGAILPAARVSGAAVGVDVGAGTRDGSTAAVTIERAGLVASGVDVRGMALGVGTSGLVLPSAVMNAGGRGAPRALRGDGGEERVTAIAKRESGATQVLGARGIEGVVGVGGRPGVGGGVRGRVNARVRGVTPEGAISRPRGPARRPRTSRALAIDSSLASRACVSKDRSPARTVARRDQPCPRTLGERERPRAMRNHLHHHERTRDRTPEPPPPG